ncbi:MAG: Gfo/Idh/MocA family protein, partial [Puniceicoccales bacterium]
MSNQPHKRYAIVGLGGRSSLFSEALLKDYKESSELVALCDTNSVRMAFHNRSFAKKYEAGPFPTYQAADFDRMIAEQKPDVVIVTTMDRTHHRYIIRAMELGCDAISEKPMTTDEEKCQEILDAVERTGRNLKVTFNYRYAPSRTKVKELLDQGTIGEVTSVHFEWLLDTQHGADYFRRWHRDKRNSGGLMVHKSTHHFDLVNWWLGSSPETVFGMGKLAFYGKENAEARGVEKFYYRGTNEPNAEGDPFALDLTKDESLKGLYLEAEKEDGYLRDQSVFSSGISIEDTMNVLVRYECGAQMTYALTAYSPWEGLRIAFNGTKGRIELEEVEKSYVNTGGGSSGEGESSSRTL